MTMVLILGAPTGDDYDRQGVPFDSAEAFVIDGRVANASVDAGARLIPMGTYRLGVELRIGDTPQNMTPEIQEKMQNTLKYKNRVLLALLKKCEGIQPIINLHGVGTSPYRGPHQTVQRIAQYHGYILECLNSVFPGHEPPLLYELIPTVEEACGIAYLCREYGWRAVVSLFVKRNSRGVLCIQNKQGVLVPVENALSQIEDAADPSSFWYAWNCFDPRLTGDLVQLLRSSRFWHRMRGIYPNLSDAENDPNYTPVWSGETESHLVSWDPPEESMPAFIGACCGSDHTHIRQLVGLKK